MTVPTTAANKPLSRCSKMAGWALLASVLVNLFLVGILVGTMPHGTHGRHKPFGPMALDAPHGDYLIGWMVRYLDPQDAEAFRAAFKAEEGNMKQAHIHVHQATSDLATAFEQDPPDTVALQTAMDRLSQAKKETDDVVGRILQSAYSKLSPEGRRRLADLTQNPS